MKIFVTFLLILFSIQSWSQKTDLTKRLEYLKQHRLFVIKLEFEHKKMNQTQLDSIISFENDINQKIKKSIDAFWDLNDSIFYIRTKDYKVYKKKYPEDVFLNCKHDYYYGMFPMIPKKKDMFIDVSPRLYLGDTSLLSITQEIRQLRYNIIHGSVLYNGADASKTILFLNEPAFNDYHEQFIEEYKIKYPDHKVVDRLFIINAVYSKDPAYIYIHELCIINVEDGSLVQLE